MSSEDVIFGGLKTTLVILFLLVCAECVRAQSKPTTAAKQILRGHPTAQVGWPVPATSLDHHWMNFFFAQELANGTARPVHISYIYYHKEQLPADSFWEYSKLYEISVSRDKRCDRKVEDLVVVRNTTTDGRELPSTFAVWFAKGAPKDLFTLQDVLPCYTLAYGNYRQVNVSRGR